MKNFTLPNKYMATVLKKNLYDIQFRPFNESEDKSVKF
jgi:hypothetical protein